MSALGCLSRVSSTWRRLESGRSSCVMVGTSIDYDYQPLATIEFTNASKTSILMHMKQRVPEVVFKTRVRDESIAGDNPFRWQDRNTADIFAGKRVVLFALPGALCVGGCFINAGSIVSLL